MHGHGVPKPISRYTPPRLIWRLPAPLKSHSGVLQVPVRNRATRGDYAIGVLKIEPSDLRVQGLDSLTNVPIGVATGCTDMGSQAHIS